MSESEILENFWNAQELGLATLSLFMSAFSAYLLVAYLAGAKLTRFQAGFISSAFTVFATAGLWGAVVYFSEGYHAGLLLESGHPAIVLLKANPAWTFAPLGLLAIAGALKFMWDVRHPGTE